MTDCQLEEFGSRVTGLAMKNSDVDCFAVLPLEVVQNPTEIVIHTEAVLRQNENFLNVEAIAKTKIPKVHFIHKPTNIFCDLTFSGRNAVKNSQLLQYLISSDERIRPLMFLIKYWSKINNFTGTRLMSNYCLILLVVFYLQHVNILPPIQLLQQNITEEMTDNWNTAFARSVNLNKNSDDVYTLLREFFCYYSNLHFQSNIISLYYGKLIKRKNFTDIQNISWDYEIYYENVTKNFCKALLMDSSLHFCIQDPFNHARNVGITVRKETAAIIVNHFKRAASIECETEDEFLRYLLISNTNSKDHKYNEKSKRNTKMPHYLHNLRGTKGGFRHRNTDLQKHRSRVANHFDSWVKIRK